MPLRSVNKRTGKAVQRRNHLSSMLLPALFLALLFTPSLAGPDLSSCSTRLYDQTLDHFSFASPPQSTFKQRYVVCDRHWSRAADGSRGPIFFYFGNEADVFLCVSPLPQRIIVTFCAGTSITRG